MILSNFHHLCYFWNISLDVYDLSLIDCLKLKCIQYSLTLISSTPTLSFNKSITHRACFGILSALFEHFPNFVATTTRCFFSLKRLNAEKIQ